MQRPIVKPVGTPREELDTPALLLDLARFEANLAARRGAARAAAWLHGTPAIAHRQIAHPCVVGIAVRGVGEAEAFAAAGCSDIRILRPLATERARDRAAALSGAARILLEDDGVPLWEEAGLTDAVTVSARVGSVPEPGLAVHDCGQKAVGRDFGDPRVVGRPRHRASAGSAEHGVVFFSERDAPYAIGDWLELAPADLATAFVLHDFVYAIRGGRLEAVWPIAARGAFQ